MGGGSLSRKGRSRQSSTHKCPQRGTHGLRGHIGESTASTYCLCVGGKRNGRRLGERPSIDGFGVVGQGSAACRPVAAHYADQRFRLKIQFCVCMGTVGASEPLQVYENMSSNRLNSETK